jgi:hypothetical protein
VVAHDPQDAQGRHRAALDVLLEILKPDVDAELVRDAQIERREVLDQILLHHGERGGCDRRILVGKGLVATRLWRTVCVELLLEVHTVVIKLSP